MCIYNTRLCSNQIIIYSHNIIYDPKFALKSFSYEYIITKHTDTYYLSLIFFIYSVIQSYSSPLGVLLKI